MNFLRGGEALQRDMDKTREVGNHQLHETEQEQVMDFLPVMG